MDQLRTISVLLNPRPYENEAGKLLLVPLLPDAPPRSSLPREVWERVLAHAVHGPYVVDPLRTTLSRAQWRAELVTVCRTFSVR